MAAEHDRNQGEGNRDAAKAYNKDTRDFMKKESVGNRAQQAEDALEGKESESLKEAEEKGRSKAGEFDPQVHRERAKPNE